MRAEDNLTFLSNASKILSSSLDYKTTLANVAKLAVPQIADWCVVHMLEYSQLLQVVLAHKDPKKVKWAKEIGKQYPTDMNAPTGVPNVIRTGKSELYPEISDDLLVKAAKDAKHLKLLRTIGFTSAMIVPICVEKKCIGCITFVTTETRRRYAKTDLTIAEELATRVGLAIENIRHYDELQKAVAMRDEFISVASHELKTPVTSLKMYTQGLKRQFAKRGNEPLAQYLSRMDDQVDKLTVLIKDLLDVSRLRFGQLQFHKTQFDLNEVVKNIVEIVQATSSKHTIAIKGVVEKKVWGDKDRIGQVLTNLLSNAIKYSPKAKRVLVRVSQERDKAIVSVQDFGFGIDKEHQNKIFSRFYRVNAIDEKTFPGMGLGLYISNEIIKKHGGQMNVVSRKGKGSQFSFTIPHQHK